MKKNSILIALLSITTHLFCNKTKTRSWPEEQYTMKEISPAFDERLKSELAELRNQKYVSTYKKNLSTASYQEPLETNNVSSSQKILSSEKPSSINASWSGLGLSSRKFLDSFKSIFEKPSFKEYSEIGEYKDPEIDLIENKDSGIDLKSNIKEYSRKGYSKMEWFADPKTGMMRHVNSNKSPKVSFFDNELTDTPDDKLSVISGGDETYSHQDESFDAGRLNKDWYSDTSEGMKNYNEKTLNEIKKAASHDPEIQTLYDSFVNRGSMEAAKANRLNQLKLNEEYWKNISLPT